MTSRKCGLPKNRRRSTLPRFVRSFQNILECAVFATGIAGAATAHAQSGEPLDSAGVFLVTTAQCEVLRDKTEVEGDYIFACDADREQCQLISDAELNEGIARGFCEDVFPTVRLVGPGDVLEEDKLIHATMFGVNTGVIDDDDNEADILCQTFVDDGQGVKACRKIIKDEDGCPLGGCPVCNDRQIGPAAEFITTFEDNCTELQALLANTVSSDANPNLSFGLFIDVADPDDPDSPILGQPGSEALLVCPGHRWECVDPSTSPLESAATIEYQFSKAAIATPVCTKTLKGWKCF